MNTKKGISLVLVLSVIFSIFSTTIVSSHAAFKLGKLESLDFYTEQEIAVSDAYLNEQGFFENYYTPFADDILIADFENAHVTYLYDSEFDSWYCDTYGEFPYEITVRDNQSEVNWVPGEEDCFFYLEANGISTQTAYQVRVYDAVMMEYYPAQTDIFDSDGEYDDELDYMHYDTPIPQAGDELWLTNSDGEVTIFENDGEEWFNEEYGRLYGDVLVWDAQYDSNWFPHGDCIQTVTFAGLESDVSFELHEDYYYCARTATTKRTGINTHVCNICEKELYDEYYAKIKSVKLSKTVLTYNKKAQKPGVTVTDADGNGLVKGFDYTVTYQKGCTNPGKYAVKVQFINGYSGSLTLYFTILPKGTSVAKIAGAKKAFTVKWKKQATQTNGYQIQYSTSASFKKAKTVTIKNPKTISKKISKLASKKVYYVRVRTYRTVSKVHYFSTWSKAVKVKTK